MKRLIVAFGPLLILAGILAAGSSFTTMTYFCSECAKERREVQVRPFGMRSLGTLTSKESASKWTKLVEAVDPGPCRHRLVFVHGSGGSYL